MTQPNLLFLFSDQQRWDTCGCYGQPLAVTPNLDRLAAEGVRFERAYTCQPVCGPARACLQTGLYAEANGCYTNNIALDYTRTPEFLAPRLAQAGYETGYLGKWHLASTGENKQDVTDRPPMDHKTKPVPPAYRAGYNDFWLASDILEFTSHGYDGYMFDADMDRREFPEGRYRADAQTDWLLEFLQSRTGDRPWFLFSSWIEPHHQNDHNHYEGPHGSKERFADFVCPGDLVETEGDWREEYPDYLGCINALDHNLGRILDELERLGMRENTIIIYTSDHGSHFRTRNRGYKRSCHEGCVRIPMVIHGPGFTGGRVVDELVSLIDLPPTLLAGAGIDVPDNWHGRALQPLAEGAAVDWPEEAFIQISESQCGRAIVTKKWKYSCWVPGFKGPRSDTYTEAFLYDLENDPDERHNLVADPGHAEVRAQLAERLKARMVAAGETAPAILPADA